MISRDSKFLKQFKYKADKEISGSESDGSTANGKSESNGDSESAQAAKQEKILQSFQRRYSDISKMDIQDKLIACKWDQEVVMKELDSEYSDLVAKNKRQTEQANGASNGFVSKKSRTKTSHKYAAINAAQRTSDSNGDSTKGKLKLKRARFEDSEEEDESSSKREKVYESSDSDSEDEGPKKKPSAEMTKIRQQIVEFLNDATEQEMEAVPNLSKKRVEKLIACRPFDGYEEAIETMRSTSGLSPDILNSIQSLLSSRNIIAKLMTSCDGLVHQMKNQVEKINDRQQMTIKEQPKLLDDKMKLAKHQLVGINWMALLYEKGLNGILADEMGLGKTIQVVSFLTWLHEQGNTGPHVIIVPSSTLDNWHREFSTWSPKLKVVIYWGPQEDRKTLRLDILNRRIELNVIIATYSTLSSTAEDRGFFRKMKFVYAVFDEAHMLKNMMTQRYQSLMQISSDFKLMLTGTPLQNNLIELMSLLTFTMPNLFASKKDHMTSLFKGCKAGTDKDSGQNKFELERIRQAKVIMQPFVLRRLKCDVLDNLPEKHENVERVDMTPDQHATYRKLVKDFKKTVAERKNSDDSNSEGSVVMQLRKGANHPLLLRTFYTNDKVKKMSKLICKRPEHREKSVDLVIEDMMVMSDFEIDNLCVEFGSFLDEYRVPDSLFAASGKCIHLQKLISEHMKENRRILIFSQFCMVLDILEKFLFIEKHNYLRIDGSTPVSDRQDLIDSFNKDETIPIFLLSTKACGLGINLTSANVVILHDIDFNPYNDKQAEDRCHRIGQTREVYIHKLISKGTIEEAMFSIADEKLKLEQRVTQEGDEDTVEKATVVKLLKQCLEMD